MKNVLMSVVVAMAFSSVWSAEELQTLGLPTIDDVRVDALVSSHWGQKTDTGYSNTGNPCCCSSCKKSCSSCCCKETSSQEGSPSC